MTQRIWCRQMRLGCCPLADCLEEVDIDHTLVLESCPGEQPGPGQVCVIRSLLLALTQPGWVSTDLSKDSWTPRLTSPLFLWTEGSGQQLPVVPGTAHQKENLGRGTWEKVCGARCWSSSYGIVGTFQRVPRGGNQANASYWVYFNNPSEHTPAYQPSGAPVLNDHRIIHSLWY